MLALAEYTAVNPRFKFELTILLYRLEMDIMLGNWAAARLKDLGEVGRLALFMHRGLRLQSVIVGVRRGALAHRRRRTRCSFALIHHLGIECRRNSSNSRTSLTWRIQICISGSPARPRYCPSPSCSRSVANPKIPCHSPMLGATPPCALVCAVGTS